MKIFVFSGKTRGAKICQTEKSLREWDFNDKTLELQHIRGTMRFTAWSWLNWLKIEKLQKSFIEANDAKIAAWIASTRISDGKTSQCCWL